MSSTIDIQDTNQEQANATPQGPSGQGEEEEDVEYSNTNKFANNDDWIECKTSTRDCMAICTYIFRQDLPDIFSVLFNTQTRCYFVEKMEVLKIWVLSSFLKNCN